MILSEPLTIVISKTHVQNLALFKIKDNEYLLCGGIQTAEMNSDLKDNYFIIEGEDTIPFVIYHNWLNMYSREVLRKYGKNHWRYLTIINAYIENKLDSNISIEDLANKYINDLNLRLKLKRANLIDLSNEIYMHLVENAINNLKEI